jgi:hypothetical protein
VHRTANHSFREPSEIEGYEQIVKWTKRVQSDEQQVAVEMLRAFGLDGVYSATDPVPDFDGAASIMRANSRPSAAQNL